MTLWSVLVIQLTTMLPLLRVRSGAGGAGPGAAAMVTGRSPRRVGSAGR